MSEEILTEVIASIARQKQLDPGVLSGKSALDELGITSLDAITIVYEMEEEFDIEVPSDVLEGLRTVQDIVDSISSLVEDTR